VAGDSADRVTTFEFESAAIGVVRVGRQQLIGRLLVYGSLGALLGTPAFAWLLPQLVSVAAYGSLAALAGMGLGVLWLAGIRTSAEERRGAPGRLVVAGDELWLEFDRRRVGFVLPPADGWREEAAGGRQVVLRCDRNVLVSVAVESSRDAHALLDAVGASAGQRAVRLVLHRTARRTRQTIGLLALVLALLGFWLPVASLVVLVIWLSSTAAGPLTSLLFVVTVSTLMWGAVLASLARLLLPTQLTIGTEGLVVRRPWRRSKPLPYTRIRGIRFLGNRLVIRPEGQAPIQIRTASASDARAARRRILEARRIARSDGVDAARLQVLERGDRSAGEWLRVLARLGSGLDELAPRGGAYRGHSLSRRELAEVVESPRASPLCRVAATYALSFNETATERARVRVAIDTCADPELREALERAEAQQFDFDALERVLARHV